MHIYLIKFLHHKIMKLYLSKSEFMYLININKYDQYDAFNRFYYIFVSRNKLTTTNFIIINITGQYTTLDLRNLSTIPKSFEIAE